MNFMSFKELKTLVKEMRDAQRKYYKTKPNTPEKKELLIRSRKLEAEVDAVVSSSNTLF